MSCNYSALLLTDNLSCPLTRPTIYLSPGSPGRTPERDLVTGSDQSLYYTYIGKERLGMNVTDEDGW